MPLKSKNLFRGIMNISQMERLSNLDNDMYKSSGTARALFHG